MAFTKTDNFRIIIVFVLKYIPVKSPTPVLFTHAQQHTPDLNRANAVFHVIPFPLRINNAVDIGRKDWRRIQAVN